MKITLYLRRAFGLLKTLALTEAPQKNQDENNVVASLACNAPYNITHSTSEQCCGTECPTKTDHNLL